MLSPAFEVPYSRSEIHEIAKDFEFHFHNDSYYLPVVSSARIMFSISFL